MKKLQLFGLASLLMLTFSTQANITSSNNAIVGSLEGELNVTQGSLSWNLPLNVPAGVNGIRPGLGISFQQGKGNGLLGLGFQVDGLSEITRCPSTSEYDGLNQGVGFNTDDKYCFGGQRLIAVNGQYGASGTEYRTATESFSKIISKGRLNNGPRSWEVYAQDGTIYTYGETANARLINQSHNATLHWSISTQKDRFDNQITYHYQASSNGSENIPTQIKWNNHSIDFHYEDRPDVFSAWQYGDQKALTKRLSRINIQTDNQTDRYYRFDYQSSEQSDFSRLDAMQLCVDNNCTPPTQFSWRENDYTDELTSIIESVEEIDALDITEYAHSQIADLNQDGFEDVCILKQGLQCGLNDGTGKMQPLQHWTNALNDNHWHHPKYASSFTLIDLNNDALPDYCIQDDQGITCGINQNGESFTQATRWSSEFTYDTFTQLNDINGDGFTDICQFEEQSVSCALNQQGGSFANSTRLINGGWPTHYGEGDDKALNGTLGFIDINLDGFEDICGVDDAGYACYLHESHQENQLPTYGHRTVWSTEFAANWDEKTFQNSFRYADLNADNLIDVCFQNTSQAYQCAVNTGTKFAPASTWASTTDWHAEGFALSTLMLIDMSGDGRSDLCLSTDARTLFCAINQGDQFANQKLRYADLRYSDEAFKVDGSTYIQPQAAPFSWSDINADGADDLCYRGYKGLSCALSNLNDQGTLVEVKTGFGNVSTIEYRNMNDPAIYTPDAEKTDGLIDLTANQYLVSSISTSNGIGSTNQMQYRYAGYKAHPTKGSRGFRYITETDTARDLQTLTEYSQNEDLLGQPVMVSVSIGGKPVRESLSSFKVVQGINEHINVIQQETLVDKEYDQNGEPLSQASTRYEDYDNYGNAKRIVVESQMENDNEWLRKTTQTRYLNSPSPWIISKPLDVQVTHENEQGSITRKTVFTYHGVTGALLSEQQNPEHALALKQFFKYDQYGNRTLVIQENKSGHQRKATTVYDASGQFPIQNINALGHTETITYNTRCGSPATQTGPNGLTTRWEYDALCQKAREIRPDGTQTQWERQWSQGYEEPYQLTDHSVYTVTAKTTGVAPKTIWFDSQNREVRTHTEGFNGKAIYQDKIYNARGQLKRATLPYHEGKFPGDGAQWVETDYDAFDRLVEQRKPTADDPIITRYAYQGNTTIITLPNGETKTTINNLFDKPQTIKEGSGDNQSLIQYTYDPLGNLLKTDTNGQIIRMAYDELGNKISMSDPAMGEWAYAYNAFGELVYQIDAKGQETDIEYDLLGRMIKRTEQEGTSTWEYDTAKQGIGKLAKEANAQTQTTYTYDELGRPTKTTKTIDGESFATDVRYDDKGRPVEETYPDGMKILREYTDTGYLKTIKTPAETVQDYDYSQLEETLALLLQQIFALQQQANDNNDKFLQYIKQAEAYQITALEWQKKAREVVGGNAALEEAAKTLKAEAERLEKIARSYKEQADYYRDLADKYAKKYNNTRFNLVKNEKGYAEYASSYCTSKKTWTEKKYGTQQETRVETYQVENPAWISLNQRRLAYDRSLPAEPEIEQLAISGNLHRQLMRTPRYITKTRTVVTGTKQVLISSKTYSQCVAWQNLQIKLPQIDFSKACDTNQTQEGLAWCAYGAPRELNLANFYKTRASQYQQFIDQAEDEADDKETLAEEKEREIAENEALEKEYLEKAAELESTAKKLEQLAKNISQNNAEELAKAIAAYEGKIDKYQRYIDQYNQRLDKYINNYNKRLDGYVNRYNQVMDRYIQHYDNRADAHIKRYNRNMNTYIWRYNQRLNGYIARYTRNHERAIQSLQRASKNIRNQVKRWEPHLRKYWGKARTQKWVNQRLHLANRYEKHVIPLYKKRIKDYTKRLTGFKQAYKKRLQSYKNNYRKRMEAAKAAYRKRLEKYKANYSQRVETAKDQYASRLETAKERNEKRYLPKIKYYEKKVKEYQQQALEEQERARQGVHYLKELRRKIDDYEQASTYLKAQLNNQDGTVLIWAATSYDASGRLQGEVAGNGLVTRKEFDPYSGHLRRITTGIQGQQGLVRDLHYNYDNMDNVTQREDTVAGLNEHYRYDSFDRLIQVNRTTQSGQGDLQKRYDYDLYGNMTYKSDAGSMTYDTSNNRLLSLTSSKTGIEKAYHYDDNGNRIQAGKQTIDWTSFNKAARV